MAENNLSADLLPDDAFPFYMHQGYQVAYFHAAPNPDKRIYFYSEGNDMKEFVVVADSFVEYWWMLLKGYHKIDKPKRR